MWRLSKIPYGEQWHMKINFELSENDLKHFRKIMRSVRQRFRDVPESEIVEATKDLLENIDESTTPDFITDRMHKLRQLIEMLEDEEWALSGKDRERVVHGMTYFAEPEDMIPDRVPVLGYLDDAIMVELVVGELAAELEAYRDFCDFRLKREERFGKDEDPGTRAEWLVSRRKQLHQRMRRRRSRRRQQPGGAAPRISLW